MLMSWIWRIYPIGLSVSCTQATQAGCAPASRGGGGPHSITSTPDTGPLAGLSLGEECCSPASSWYITLQARSSSEGYSSLNEWRSVTHQAAGAGHRAHANATSPQQAPTTLIIGDSIIRNVRFRKAHTISTGYHRQSSSHNKITS